MSRRWPSGRLSMAALIAPVYIPATLMLTLGQTVAVATLGIGLIFATSGVIGSSVYATLQEMTPNHCRSRILALYALAHGLVGVMLGAPSIAFLTDTIFGDPAAVNLSMLIIGCTGTLIAFILFCLGLKGFCRMREMA